MRKKVSILTLLLLAVISMAAPVSNMPVLRVQPNGDTLRCWVSGDEFFHRLHDAEGYTIIQNVKTGEFVYAQLSDGLLVPTPYVPGRDNPAQVGLSPNLVPGTQELQRLHHLWDIPEQYRAEAPKTSGRNHGTLNNLVIFIRFNDESSCTSAPFDTINAMFNDSTAGVSSMYNFFKTASYHNLNVLTTYRPAPTGSTVLSFQDSLNRSYYMPYSATNPTGYTSDNQRRSREFSLLQRAVNWVNTNCPVSSSVNLDMDNDGFVDNICFVVSGSYTGWNDLLWPHKWSLYDRYVYINGKRVYTFNLQLAGSGSHYFSVSTFCHEMTHTLGAPDLYHYYNFNNVSPAGSWDLMCSNQTPPQQTNSIFKYDYLNWFDSIPQITDSGTYSLQSLATGPNHAYKIAAAAPHQWYILEYRDIADTFDSSLPNRGLLIWRYNDLPTSNNAYFNNSDTLHELWLFRPNSSDDTTHGISAQAGFGLYGRNTFSAACGNVSTASNPFPYLCSGTPDTSFSLINIQVSSDSHSVSFTFVPNDSTSCPTVNSFPLTLDFEDGVLGCWKMVSATPSNADRMGIYYTDGYIQPHGGNYHFRFSSYVVTTDYNQYLISPRLQPSNPLHMVFYYRKFHNPHELFSVKYSSTGNDVADFTHTLADIDLSSSGGWQRCDVMVPDTARYVAINYHSNYSYYLYIDDIQLRDTLVGMDVRDTTFIYVHDTMYYDSHDTVEVSVFDTVLVTPEARQVLVYPNEANRGKASGSGTFLDGTVLEIAGIPNEGFRFDHWMDGNTDNPRTVLVNSDLLYSAYFVSEDVAKDFPGLSNTNYYHDTVYVHDTIWLPDPNGDTVFRYVYHTVELDTTTYYTLEVLSNDGAKGIVAGSGWFPKGTAVELAALPLPGYRLWHWDDLSHDNPKTVVVTGDMTITASFIEKDAEGITPTLTPTAKVYAHGTTIVVELQEPQEVSVFNVLGQRLYHAPQAQGTARISSLPQGLYLVKVGPAPAQKIVLLTP